MLNEVAGSLMKSLEDAGFY